VTKLWKTTDNGRWIYYSLEETCDILDIKLSSIAIYLATHKLKADIYEGHWAIRDVELERFIQQRRANRAKAGRRKKIQQSEELNA